MTIRPGRNAVLLAATLFGLAFASFWSWHVVWLLLAIAVAGLVLAFVDYRWLARQFENLSVERYHAESAPRGDSFSLRWRVSTTGRESLRGDLREVLPAAATPRIFRWSFTVPDAVDTVSTVNAGALTPGRRIVEQTASVILPERGRHRLGPTWVRLAGRWRLVDGQREMLQDSSIRILPETYASPERFQKDAGAEIRLLDQPVFTRQKGHGTEFESLKEYRLGDDPRRIDWRATARARRPIVRQFQVERHRDVMILIDCGRLMGSLTPRGTKLDCAVDSALLLGRIALQGGDRCGFALFDHSLRGYHPPLAGLPAVSALVDAVYDARVDWGETDFNPLFATLQRRQAKRSLLIILSDVLDTATSEQYRGSLLQLAQRHVVLFAALRTPLLSDVVNVPIESMHDAARQAVAYRLLNEREQAIQTLRHGGLHVVDVEPHQLTAPLINEFLAIRRRNLL
ncbi:MAG: DUF58 domain-containing protein [Planctomycetaceae bacterium]